MRLFSLVVVAATLVSCSTLAMGTKPPDERIPLEPLTANRYENVLSYPCDGQQAWGFGGTSACQYAAGTTVELQVKVPPTKGQVVVRSRRKEVVVDFNKNVWVKVPWVLEDRFDSVPVVVTVAGVKSGVQLAKWYPYVTDKKYVRMTGGLRVFCYEHGTYDVAHGQVACQQPVDSLVDGTAQVDETQAGEYLFSASGCALIEPAQARGNFGQGTKVLPFRVTRDQVGNCAVKVAVKYPNGAFTEAELYLDWWDVKYVPLSKPVLKYISEKEAQVCGPFEFEFYEINGKQKKDGLLCSDCEKEPWLAGGWAYGLAWDEAGRMSYQTLRKGDK